MITRKGDTDTLRRLMEMSQLRWRDPRTPMDEQLHPCNATWGALDGLADRDLPATSIILDPRDEFFDIFGLWSAVFSFRDGFLVFGIASDRR